MLNSFIKYSHFLRNHVSFLCNVVSFTPFCQTFFKKISRANQVFWSSDSVKALKIFLGLIIPVLVNFWLVGCVIGLNTKFTKRSREVPDLFRNIAVFRRLGIGVIGTRKNGISRKLILRGVVSRWRVAVCIRAFIFEH